ncbi:MAG: hypothetical protein JWM91_3550 [Rhodospirillales bacterium]|nr:hypothetical protein [Rhodospirillales bacterium]
MTMLSFCCSIETRTFFVISPEALAVDWTVENRGFDPVVAWRVQEDHCLPGAVDFR